MGLWDKLFKGGVKEVTDGIEGILDEVITNDEERLTLKKQLTEVLTNFSNDMITAQRDVLITEMQGNWLQRSWRPLIMIFFAVVVGISIFTDTHLGAIPERFWGLLEIGLGGYVIGRTAEKMVGKVTDNLDKIPGRKDKK